MKKMNKCVPLKVSMYPKGKKKKKKKWVEDNIKCSNAIL